MQYLIGAYPSAIVSITEALALSDELGDRLGRANALNYLGRAQYSGAMYAEAAVTLAEALELYRELGDRLGQAEVLNNQGALLLVSPSHEAASDALDYYMQSLHLAREVCSPIEEARA